MGVLFDCGGECGKRGAKFGICRLVAAPGALEVDGDDSAGAAATAADAELGSFCQIGSGGEQGGAGAVADEDLAQRTFGLEGA